MLSKLKINKSVLLGILLALFGSTSLVAQNAELAFDASAQEYISGSKELAKQMVMEALNKYPGDQKLTSLLAKIEEEQQNEDQQNKGQQNQDQEDKEEQDKKDSEDQQNQDEQKKDDKEGQGDKKEEQEQKEGKQPQPASISREDAERLLEALNKEEQDIQKKVNAEKLKGKPIKTEKDW